MISTRYPNFVLAAACLFISLSAKANPIPRIKPTVSFSEPVDCPHGMHENYFDFTYFNSEIAPGSQVWLQYGFERGGVPGTGWYSSRMIEMKQWEQFGWYARVNLGLMPCGCYRSNLSGVDFVVQIKSPDGQIAREPSLDQGFQGYYRANTLNIPSCSTAEGGQLKTCTADVEWVNVH